MKKILLLAATLYAFSLSVSMAQTANNPTVINGTDSTGFPIYAPVGNGTNGSVPMPVTVSGGSGETVTANQGTAAPVSGGWPVIAGEPADTTGTFTNATQGTAITTPSVDGYETATITISGTYNTATATFLASDDGGTTYYTLSCARTDSAVVETGYTALTNTNRAWFCPIHSFDTIRIQSSAVASGTVNVRISISSPPTTAGAVVSVSAASTIGVEGIDGSTQASPTNGFPVVGTVASGSADSGNPVKVGCKYNSTLPTFTDGQRGDCQVNTKGGLIVQPSSASGVAYGSNSGTPIGVSASQNAMFVEPYNLIYNGLTNQWDGMFTCTQSAAVSVTAGNTTQIVALSGTTVIRVCSIIGSISLAGTMTVSYGTGTNCGTGNTALTGTMALATGTPVNLSNGMGSVVRSAAGNAICIAAATGNFTGVLTYAQY